MNKRYLKMSLGMYIVLAVIGLYGCEKNTLNEPITLKENDVPEMSYTLRGYAVTRDAVRRQALDLMALLDKNSLRSLERKIENITPISEQVFRATDVEGTSTAPLAYIVNFTNNSGYTVLSADSRLEPVWILSEQGNLDIEREPDNPTVLMLMKQVELAYNLDRYELVDQLILSDDVHPDITITYTEYGPWEHIAGAKYNAFIPVVWGQSKKPYNLYIPPKSIHAGCVTAAVAQIMAFHCYPRSYNWSEMLKHHPLDNPTAKNPKAYQQIGLLYKDLGLSLRVQYAPNGSSAYSVDVPQTFRQFGYTNGGYFSDFSFSSIQNELKRDNGKGFPVYISASDKMKVRYKHVLWWKKKEISYESGHAFVIDGISTARRLVREIDKYTGKEVSRHYETIDLLHANLGWDNIDYNGYYNKNVFDVNNGPILKNMNNSVIGKDYVYRYNFKTVTGIRP